MTDIYCSTTDPEVKTRCFNEANAIRNNVDNQTSYPQNSALGALYDAELRKDGSVSASDWLRISNTLHGEVSPGAIDTVNGAQNMVDEYYKQKQIDKAFDSVYNDLDVNRSKSTNNFNNSDTGSAFAKGISSGIPKGVGKAEGLTIGVVDPIFNAAKYEAEILLDKILSKYHPYEWPDSYSIKEKTWAAYYEEKYNYEVNRANDIASFFSILDIGTTIKDAYEQALKSTGGGFLPVTIVGTIVFTTIDKAWKKEPGVGDLPETLGISSSLNKDISRALEKSEFVNNSIYKYLVYSGPFLWEEGPRGMFINEISELQNEISKKSYSIYNTSSENNTFKQSLLAYLTSIKNMNINYKQSVSEMNYFLDKIDDKY